MLFKKIFEKEKILKKEIDLIILLAFRGFIIYQIEFGVLDASQSVFPNRLLS